MKSFFKKSEKSYLIILAMLVVIAAGSVLFFSSLKAPTTEETSGSTTASPTIPQEIKSMLGTQVIAERVKLYKQLIDRVGPVEAQDDLFRSGLPFDGQTHLLNHTIGDYLYTTKGPAGLSLCRDYFLSSCYHGFVLHALAASNSDTVIDDIMAECNKKGPTVATQCAHAIGHGFLAYVGYKNLTDALKKCEALTTRIKNFPLFNCEDGVFMENIWAVHDDGTPSPDRWVKPSDPIYPCDDPRIDHKYINACWSNQPSLMYQLFHGDIASVGKECLTLTDRQFQTTCFDGLARQIHPLTNGSVDKVFELCSLMPTPQWIGACVVSDARAYFSVGDRTLPFQICSRADKSYQASCYAQLFGIMGVYVEKNSEAYHSLCEKIVEPEFKNQCLVFGSR
jgi:hypothetical protein